MRDPGLGVAAVPLVTSERPAGQCGSCKPVIDCCFPLDIATAHDHMAANANVGRVLIGV